MRLVAWVLSALALSSPVLAGVARDPHSVARLDEVRVKHLYLDLDVDFADKRLKGFADLTLDWKRADAGRLDLDTRDLTIDRVLQQSSDGQWRRASFRLGARHPMYGQGLRIALAGNPAKVRVHYRTSPQASGLQWLAPEQTLGKQKPFMFSQAQAAHARSFVPLQDTPAVRFTYSAHVRAPEGIRVLMSADNDPAATGVGGYRFTMPQPIPSYLLAIAAGDLAFQSIGPRSGVYTEPGRLAAAAKEFEDTEAMIAATEKLYGPYRWGRYDLLILPPSFPFGGMENPRLSFITPTVIAGDKSLVSLIAHELAHSWSGNLVTNETWDHIWLNEGFTSYVENRITEAVFGLDQAKMEQVISQRELAAELKELAPEDQRLVVDLKGRDPDAGLSGVPYDKGQWLLRTMEKRLGREVFDPMLRAWFDAHAFQSVNTDTFLAFFGPRVFDKPDSRFTRAEVLEWLNQPGVPASAPMPAAPWFDVVDAARADFLAGKRPAAALEAKGWITQQWLHFLNELPADLKADRLAELDAAYNLSQTKNAEIAMRWFLAGIRANYEPIREPLRAHLIGIGRRKLMMPLWAELAKTPEGKRWATEVYAVARPGYHPIAQASVDEVLK